jgi:hypothetical protein
MFKTPTKWKAEIDAKTPFGVKAGIAIARANRTQTRIKTKASSIGDFLHTIIKRETGVDVPCSACKTEIERLNGLTPEEVKKDLSNIAAEIVKRSSYASQTWYQKLAINYVPFLVKIVVESWVLEACENEYRSKK